MQHRLAIAVLLLAGSLQAARADVMDDCRGDRGRDVRLRACTALITSPRSGPDAKALAYRYRGEARNQAGAFGQAIVDFNESIRLRNDDALAYAGRGWAKFSLRNVSIAIRDYDEAIRLSPAIVDLYIERGHIHLANGDADASVRDLSEAIRLSPKSASAYNNRGLARRKKGDLDGALEDYSTAILINPVYALAYANRGYLRESLGRKDEAIQDFRQALLLDLSLVGARQGLTRLGSRQGIAAESGRRIRDGKALAERNCGGCHAVGVDGRSPNSKAPEFRNLSRRHPLIALREPIRRGIAAPHDEMPAFVPSDEQIDAIVAYINSLSAAR